MKCLLWTELTFTTNKTTELMFEVTDYESV